MIISYLTEKIKQGKAWFSENEKELLFAGLVIVGMTLAYGLGRLSKFEASQPPVTITLPSTTDMVAAISSVASVPTSNTEQGKITASKNGSKYYFPWCNSANIKQANRIYFDNEAAAQAKGYTLAANCKAKP